MGSPINLKARVERQSRILQRSIYKKTRKGGKFGVSIVSCISIFLLPVYPTFSNFVNNTNEIEFDRTNIDESSIISSFIGDISEETSEGEGDVFIQSKDSYLHVSAELDADKKDTSTSDTVIEHTVGEDDTFASIAEQYKISESSIYSANNFNTEHQISEGDVLKLPPVTGLIHTVRSGESIIGLARAYNIDIENIMRQNVLLESEELLVGQTLIIPGAEKAIPKPAAPKPVYSAPAQTHSYVNATPSSSQYVNTSGRYKLVWRSPYSGAPGNCTWYVASYKNVNWRGNANQWMRNAAAKGHPIGYTPSIGAIIQFAGSGYNPYYGHVGIVIDMTDTHLIVSDMNYRAKYEVTTRKIPINDRSIQGYIYVN